MESWVFLLVGGLGAVGAAMSIGTLAAWVRYERTGELPGDDPEPPADPKVRRRLLVRIVLGVVVAVACAVVLAQQGLLAGPSLG